MVQEFPFIYMLCVCVFVCVLLGMFIQNVDFTVDIPNSFYFFLFPFFFAFFVIFYSGFFFQDLNYNLSGYIFQISGQFIFRMLVLKVLLVRFWIGHLRLK